MGRRAAREFAMKLIYQLEIHKENLEEQMKLALEEEEEAIGEKDRQYINDVTEGVFLHLEHLDKLVENYSKGWNITRIPKVDLSILRLGIYEICFRDDIPYSVTINEAVELAKKFSGEEAGAFINGILSKIPKSKAAAFGIDSGSGEQAPAES